MTIWRQKNSNDSHSRLSERTRHRSSAPKSIAQTTRPRPANFLHYEDPRTEDGYCCICSCLRTVKHFPEAIKTCLHYVSPLWFYVSGKLLTSLSICELPQNINGRVPHLVLLPCATQARTNYSAGQISVNGWELSCNYPTQWDRQLRVRFLKDFLLFRFIRTVLLW